MKNLILLSIIAGLLFPGCRTKSKLTKRYKSFEIINSDSWIKKNIEVNAYFIEEEKKSSSNNPKTIFDLTSNGQATLIQELGKKDSTSSLLLKHIKQDLTNQKKSTNSVIDYTQFRKRLIVSIRNKRYSPGDRISKINITFKLKPNVKILSCDKLITDFQILELGKLNYSNTQSAELNGNIGTENSIEKSVNQDNSSEITRNSTSLGGNGKLSATQSFSEEVLLQKRKVALNVSINDNELTIYQESLRGNDLTGNVIADILFEITEDVEVSKIYSFSNLMTKNVFNAPDKIKVSEKRIFYPDISTGIEADISFEASIRHIEKNHDTEPEFDDVVQLYYGKASNIAPEVLVPKSKTQPYLWFLTVQEKSIELPVQVISPSSPNPGDIIFDSYSQAQEFLIWLKTIQKDLKGLQFGNKYYLKMPNNTSKINDIKITAYN